MSNNINQQIEARVQAFVQELSELVKIAALEAVVGALGGKPMSTGGKTPVPAYRLGKSGRFWRLFSHFPVVLRPVFVGKVLTTCPMGHIVY
jgi:hypothetical protein